MQPSPWSAQSNKWPWPSTLTFGVSCILMSKVSTWHFYKCYKDDTGDISISHATSSILVEFWSFTSWFNMKCIEFKSITWWIITRIHVKSWFRFWHLMLPNLPQCPHFGAFPPDSTVLRGGHRFVSRCYVLLRLPSILGAAGHYCWSMQKPNYPSSCLTINADLKTKVLFTHVMLDMVICEIEIERWLSPTTICLLKANIAYNDYGIIKKFHYTLTWIFVYYP